MALLAGLSLPERARAAMVALMQAPREIDRTTTPDGETLTLLEHAGDHIVRVGGITLMSSAEHHSEEHMAEVACAGHGERPTARVLVGGLGLGYTLRAVLDRVHADACVVVAELLPAIVEWNRGPLAPLAGRPLDDPRVQIEVGDVLAHLASRPAPYDAILLDVDNGPEPLTIGGNLRLYGDRGLAHVRAALAPRGVVVVWSAFECPPFVNALRRARLRPEVVRTRARRGKGPRHTLYVGRRG